MSLKDDIEMVLEDAYWIGSDAAKGRREVEPSMLQARDKADRILALVAEAMLSKDVVEAGAGGYQDLLKEWGGEMGAIGADDIGLGVFDVVMGEVGRDDNAYELANAALTAALDAMIGKEPVDGISLDDLIKQEYESDPEFAAEWDKVQKERHDDEDELAALVEELAEAIYYEEVDLEEADGWVALGEAFDCSLNRPGKDYYRAIAWGITPVIDRIKQEAYARGQRDAYNDAAKDMKDMERDFRAEIQDAYREGAESGREW